MSGAAVFHRPPQRRRRGLHRHAPVYSAGAGGPRSSRRPRQGEHQHRDAAQLEALDGIGPTLAQRIVAYREEHGPFADIESIMDVNGIGEGIFETIRQQITVEDDT